MKDKIISFSLWSNNPKYVVGLRRNLELMRDVYPDWKAAVYWGTDIDRRDRSAIINEFIDIWGASSIIGGADWRNLFHRFRVLEDMKDADLFISRDCDSRLSEREAVAVEAWVDSEYGFHTIHDHYHHSVPILGGMFGIKRGIMDDIGTLGVEWGNCHEPRWQVDQDFLTQRVWPIVKHDCLNHAEFHTNIWPGVPIPISRQGREFIGASYDENDIIDAEQVRHLYG